MAALDDTALNYIESELGTRLQLQVRFDEVLTIQGSFAVSSAGFLGGYVQSLVEYDLYGVISHSVAADERPGQGYVVSGSYRHAVGAILDGFDEGGSFEMRWDCGRMCGWWAGEDGTHHEWIWTPAIGKRQSIQRLVASKQMTRYTLFCCWLFFFQTVAQLALTICPAGATGSRANMIFNIVYSATYLSFYAAFFFMKRLPAKSYSAAVGVYTLGYTTFAWYFVEVLREGYIRQHGSSTWFYIRTAAKPARFYHAGSTFFLVGSIMLVLATIPRGEASYSAMRREASLFWGSLAFLAGSIGFFTDAMLSLTLGGSTAVGIISYICFVIGRVYFLWGSSTDDVNIWMFTSTRIRNFRSLALPICV